MTDTTEFNSAELPLKTGAIAYLHGGSGETIVCLHHSWGNPGALELHNKLAENLNVIVPDMPGWGSSTRPLWARTVRDIAILMSHFIREITNVPISLVGFGFGGYVAAELATMSAGALKNLTLVGPTGVKPDEGEILDQMMLSHRQYIEDSFKDRDSYLSHFGEEPTQEMRDLWDHSREMTARITWKPYMFNRRLPQLLMNVSIPTLLVWGAHDKVIPPSVAAQFQSALRNSTVEIVEDAGHLIEIEAPSQLHELIIRHTKSQ